MSEHTPGPWVAWQERAPNGPWMVEMGAGELHIGFLPNGAPDEANARLIAAAPDLLAALRLLMEQPTMSPIDMSPAQRGALWNAHILSRLAIAKATGGTGELVKHCKTNAENTSDSKGARN